MRRLRTKMIATIGLPTLAIYVAVLGLTMLHLRREARDDVNQEMTRRAGELAARFDGAFRGVKPCLAPAVDAAASKGSA